MSTTNRPSGPNPSDPWTIAHAAPTFGPFTVLSKLGEGGMGAVYLAEDVKLKRRVAIKTMRPELASDAANRGRFEREARTAAAVEHDNIVPILHVGEASDGTPYIVMPYLKGEPLDARLKRERFAPLDLILKVAREVAEGLAAAHAAGLIHRDIKPANIWLEGDPTSPNPSLQVRRCKILDFGLARSVEGNATQLTASGAILGTPAYMAPEQARGEKVDAQADLFSLGVTLYRMATGKVPFDGPNPMAVLIALTTDTPRSVRQLAPGLPPELLDLIDRLMSKDRDARPRSAREVAAILSGGTYLQKERSAVPPVPVPTPSPLNSSEPQILTPDGDEEPAPRERKWLPFSVAAACLLALAPLMLWAAGAFGGKGPAAAGGDDPPSEQPVAQTAKGDDPPPKKGELKVDEPPKPVKPPADAGADHRAALWVLSVRGAVLVDHGDTYIERTADLPKTPYRLMGVDLFDAKFRDAELAVFAGCQNLTALDLGSTNTTDDALAYFAGCKNLTDINVSDTGVTEAGLVHFKACKDLQSLDVSRTRLTDAGMPLLRSYKYLSELHLTGTGVTDVGLAEFRGCTSLTDLSLPEGATDIGLAYFKDCTKLTNLHIGSTAATTAGLAHFKNCKSLESVYLPRRADDAALLHFKDCRQLRSLHLSRTALTDKGLEHVKQFTNLTLLYAAGTKVTATGVAGVAKALPKCKIRWDGGTIDPAKK